MSDPSDAFNEVDFHKIPQSVEEDSDDSLGILDFNLLDDEMSEDELIIAKSAHSTESDEFYYDNLQIGSAFVLPYLKTDFENNFNKLKIEHESASTSRDNTFTEHVASTEPESVNDFLKEPKDLNTTVTFDNCATEFSELKMVKEKNGMNDTFILSESIASKPLLLPIFNTSPILKTADSPKFASTPKHDANYTFNLDEELLNSGQNVSPLSHLNKTIVKNDLVEDKVFAQSLGITKGMLSNTTILSSDKDGNKDIQKLSNMTCIINKFNAEFDFNKTFHVASDIVTLPDKFNALHVAKERDSNKDVYVENKVDHDYKNVSSNILNKTVSIAADVENKNAPSNILNKTVSITADLENKTMAFDLQEKQQVHKEKLNLTYEDILRKAQDQMDSLNSTREDWDKVADLPDIRKCLKIKKTCGTKPSEICKRIDSIPPPTIASSRKSSIGIPIKSDIVSKQVKNRRKSFESISSEIDFQRQNVSTEAGIKSSESRFLKVGSRSSLTGHASARYPVAKGSSTIKSKANVKEVLNNQSPKVNLLAKKPKETNENVSKNLDLEPEFLFKQTLNLTHSISDTPKCLIQKSKTLSMEGSSVMHDLQATVSNEKHVIPVKPAAKELRSCHDIMRSEERFFYGNKDQKRILVQKNAGMSSKDTKQKLGGKSSDIDLASKANKPVPCRSRIPLPAHKKKESDDKKQPGVPSQPKQKNPSCRNLR